MLQDHAAAIGWITALSFAMLAISAILVPWIVLRLPVDFFASDRRPVSRFASEHPLIRWAIIIARNLLSAILLFAGLAMLILPGQGLLTLAMAIVLADFPQKHRLEKWLLGRKPVTKSINWLRSQANVPPLQLQHEKTDAEKEMESEAKATKTNR